MNKSLVMRTIDDGPCPRCPFDDPPLHKHLDVCRQVMGVLKTRRSAARLQDLSQNLSAKGQSALHWIKCNVPTVDCTRFLLDVKMVLWDQSSGFYPAENLYWEACGSVLGELLVRKDETRVNVPSDAILESLASRFLDVRGDPWARRLHLIQCLPHFAVQCLGRVTSPDDVHFGPFWETLDIYVTHTQAAVDCMRGVRLPEKLTLAMSRLLDLWNQIITTRVKQPPEIGEVLQDKATAMAGPLFDMLWQSQPGFSQELGRWQEAMIALLESIRYRNRSESTKERFGELADKLSTAKRSLGDRVQPRLKSFFRDLIPPLHGRGCAGERKAMVEGDDECDIELKGPQSTPVTGKARIRDVCPSSYLGFQIETNVICVDKAFERGDNILGALDVGEYSYSYRSIDVRPAGGSGLVSIERVILTVRYRLDGIIHKEEFPCRIMRAWQIGDGATGLALRAPLTEIGGEIPQPWKEYVQYLLPLRSR